MASLRNITLSIGFGLISAVAPAVAHAQDTAANVSQFFAEPTETPRLRTNTSDADRVAVAFRHALNKALHLGDQAALQAIDKELRENLQGGHDGLLALLASIEIAFQDGKLDRDLLLQDLERFDAGGDWYASTVANDLLASLYMRRRESLLAARSAEAALLAIPDETSLLVSDAQLMVANRTSALYTISADPDGMLDSVRTVRRIEGELGGTFNRHEAMTNFLLAFNWKRDHKGALVMAALLDSEPEPEATLPGLSDVYVADLLNETGQHAAALDKALAARRAGDPFVSRRSRGEAMIALAGLGRRSEAIAELQAFDFWQNGAPTDKAKSSEGALHALALLSASEGDSTQAVAFMNQRLDLMVRNLREANAKDAASLLASLENSRQRQQERETALQQQAAASAEIAKRKTQLSYSLMALLGLIGGALVACVIFLRYRERVNAERSRLQEQALSAEKMKTEFLGVVNHELRTPLNGVIGISDALIHHNADPVVREQAKAIQESGEQLQDMIESMIDMTTLEGGKFELVTDTVSLSDGFAAEAERWAASAAAKGLTYTRFIAPSVDVPVTADATRLRQCLRILLSNAVKFTQSGRVHMHITAVERDGAIDFSVIVADTGQGISERVQSRLFKPFLQADSTMTRKYGGAGLSLAIARKLARMMGGDLVCQSAVDRGSEFTLTARLPMAAAMPEADAVPTANTADKAPVAEPRVPAPVSEPQQEAPLPDGVLDLMPELFAPDPETSAEGETRPRILVVEDMPSNQDVIRLMLEPRGFGCIPALSGEEGLARLAGGGVDAVVMDLRMPGMDGLETTRRIRALDGPIARIPIIALTADAGPDTRRKAQLAGADMFLSKPVVARELVAVLEHALGEAQRLTG